MLSLALDHVWQSTLFAAVVMVAVLFFRRQAARTRFWLWFAASAKFLVPFAALSALGTALAQRLETGPAAFAGYMDEPIVQMTTVSFAPLHGGGLPAATGFDWQALLLAGWLAGAAFFALRWIFNWLRVRAILRESATADIPAALPVRITAAPVQPALTGVFHPCILLPRAVLSDLSPDALEAVLAHETWHWRHRDHWWSPVHRMVEVLFWFHPLTWWLGARLNEERERACDEAVLAQGFAAETSNLLKNAKAKRAAKGCDWIVANDVSPGSGAFGGDNNTVHLVTGNGVEDWPTMRKQAVAERLAQRIAEALN